MQYTRTIRAVRPILGKPLKMRLGLICFPSQGQSLASLITCGCWILPLSPELDLVIYDGTAACQHDLLQLHKPHLYRVASFLSSTRLFIDPFSHSYTPELQESINHCLWSSGFINHYPISQVQVDFQTQLSALALERLTRSTFEDTALTFVQLFSHYWFSTGNRDIL